MPALVVTMLDKVSQLVCFILFPCIPLRMHPLLCQLSSCLIYNVEKKIQDDHLQQLELFSEYGRMALNKEQESTDSSGSAGSMRGTHGIKYMREDSQDAPTGARPFQRLEFLVRDWQVGVWLRDDPPVVSSECGRCGAVAHLIHLGRNRQVVTSPALEPRKPFSFVLQLRDSQHPAQWCVNESSYTQG